MDSAGLELSLQTDFAGVCMNFGTNMEITELLTDK